MVYVHSRMVLLRGWNSKGDSSSRRVLVHLHGRTVTLEIGNPLKSVQQLTCCEESKLTKSMAHKGKPSSMVDVHRKSCASNQCKGKRDPDRKSCSFTHAASSDGQSCPVSKLGTCNRRMGLEHHCSARERKSSRPAATNVPVLELP